MEISDRLGKLARFYDREAAKCIRGRAYLAACVMQGAALEAALYAICFVYPNEVRGTRVHQRKKFRRKRYKVLDFTLSQLINIADELEWFPSRKITWGKRTTLAGFAHELRELRNYVHPGKWAVERPSTSKFTKRDHARALEIFEVSTSWLLHRVERDLRKRMKKEGLL